MTTRIGYGKVGRVFNLTPEKWGYTGGDNEAPILLNKLARRFPDVEWVILGRTDGANPQDVGFPPNVTSPWLELRDAHRGVTRGNGPLDISGLERVAGELARVWWPTVADLQGVILWSGQHGTSNAGLLKLDGTGFVKPQESHVYYAGWLLRCLNWWRTADPYHREEVWLCPDVRNYIKCRDLMWPNRHPVLGQYELKRKHKYYRYGITDDPTWPGVTWYDPPHNRNWATQHEYIASGLELTGLPSSLEPSFEWEDRSRFGMIVNENRPYVTVNRHDIVRDWVLPLQPDFLHGNWTPKSQASLGVDIEPIHWSEVHTTNQRVRSTFTTPASGGGWATAKPWESFAAGVACFYHPKYDVQGHTLPTLAHVQEGRVDGNPNLKHLTQWLRVETPDQLARRVSLLNSDQNSWLWLVNAQHQHYLSARKRDHFTTLLQDRLKL